ncbi:CIC11C00000001419 [Sungouiella intermedia]|uniref:1-acyl-sn-glycerol-3-phosphate acyltransferase n=1 Tax=Sungouiella intermedia TaxID=45354 RepID=A0A1L0GFW6_9ASCO|nr:CIC11C00000001419 [[Candida] intermedia]
MGFLQTLKFYAKSFVFGTLIATCALYGVFASILLRLIGKPEYAQYTVARVFYFMFSKLLGVTITIKNEHYLRQNPAVVVSNHQSALDILILGKVFMPGYTVTAKKVLKYFPFLGWFMIASSTFFLDRAKSEKARKVLDRALLGLKLNLRLIFMFPEGTRSATKKLEMLPFKKGAFHLAKQAGIHVIPVAVSNYSHIFHSGDKVFNRGNILIEVLPPMETTDLKLSEDVTAFAQEVRDKMLHSIETQGYSPARGETPVVVEAEDTASEVSVEVIGEETPLVSGD